jgi:hypothetical protein
MRSKFWHGMVLGTLAATVLSAFIGSPQKKPLVERDTEAVQFSAHDFAKKARRVQRRMLKRF